MRDIECPEVGEVMTPYETHIQGALRSPTRASYIFRFLYHVQVMKVSGIGRLTVLTSAMVYPIAKHAVKGRSAVHTTILNLDQSKKSSTKNGNFTLRTTAKVNLSRNIPSLHVYYMIGLRRSPGPMVMCRTHMLDLTVSKKKQRSWKE